MVRLRQGDIIYVNLDPIQGHEQAGDRPVLILSSQEVANVSNMFIVSPISNTSREFPLYHKLRSTNRTTGKVLLDQTRSLDLRSRGVRSSGHDKVSREELEEIIHKYKLLFEID